MGVAPNAFSSQPSLRSVLIDSPGRSRKQSQLLVAFSLLCQLHTSVVCTRFGTENAAQLRCLSIEPSSFHSHLGSKSEVWHLYIAAEALGRALRECTLSASSVMKWRPKTMVLDTTIAKNRSEGHGLGKYCHRRCSATYHGDSYCNLAQSTEVV